MKAFAPPGWKSLIAIAAAVAAATLAARVHTSRGELRLADQLDDGGRYADSLEREVAASTSIRPDTATLLGGVYLERHRQGMSSPFRLVEYVLRDRRLPAASRRRLALGILGRTAAGVGYATPIEALGLLSADGRTGGLAHRSFMEAEAERAADPRAAELALRMAYQVATSSGVVSHRAPAVAVGAIAQARDRALAMRDARDLIEAAAEAGRDPLDVVPTWRASRRFRVEQPLREPPSPEQERVAAERMATLVAGLEALVEPAVPDRRRTSVDAVAAVAASAVRLALREGAPPQAPVTVTIGGLGSYVVSGARTSRSRMARSAFVTRSRNEETLAAEYVLLMAEQARSPEVAVAVMTAAVALRTYSQERTWLPGDAGPSALDLQDKLGLAALEFDGSVPASWRPYYTRMLDAVVADIRLVVPGLDLSGLRVRFGDSPLRERALALHDPATRTVYFPLATSAGAMAHELSHDLDWQAARRAYGVSTGYRTDRSVRQYRDGLAATLERLTSEQGRLTSRAASERPAEAFARGADWIVAAALAQHGVLNGYLSAVQDAVITGYASATAPRRDAPETDATIVAFRELAAASPETERWLDRQYGADRMMGLAEGVRRVLSAPLPRWDGRPSLAVGFDAMSVNSRLLRRSEPAGGWTCLLAAPSMRSRDRLALADAMTLAAGARVRGVLRRWSDFAEGTAGSAWVFRALGGAPWDPSIGDSVARELRAALLWRAARPDDGRIGLNFAERSERLAAWERCASDR